MTAFIAAFLDTWGIWAFIAGGTALIFFLLWANESHAPKPQDDPEAIAEANDLHTARTIAHIGLCGSTNGELTCDRALRHAGMHADRHTSRTGNPVAWENYGDDFGGVA